MFRQPVEVPPSPPLTRLTAILDALPRTSVAVVGDIVADVYWSGETERVSREAPVLIVRHESTDTRLGGGANVAANIAALGATPRMLGVVGSDAPGRELLRQFRRLGAPPEGILVRRGCETETKTRILAGGRSTTRQQMLRIDRACPRPLSPKDRQRFLDAVESAVGATALLLVSDYGSGLIDEGFRENVGRWAARTSVVVDSRYALRRFTGATLLKPNEPELEAAAGHRLNTDGDVESAARRLLDQTGARGLVVTRGRQGLWVVEREAETAKIPSFGPPEAVDVTGAGDTVLATLGTGMAAGASVVEAAWLANVAGGIVVQKPGTATCSHAELRSALDTLSARTPTVSPPRRRSRS